MKYSVKKLVYSAMCLALCLVLPFLTGQIPEVGAMLLPMHLPVLLCGFLCGGGWGALVGFTAPLLRHLIFSMPPMPGCISMAFELAVYGFTAGWMYRLLPKKIPYIYVSLVGSMIAGRVVWGVVKMILSVAQSTEFTLAAFLAGAITGAIPGIICHILLVPVVVIALRQAKLIPEDKKIKL